MLEWLLYFVVVWFRRAYPLPTRSLRSLVEEGVLPSNLDKSQGVSPVIGVILMLTVAIFFIALTAQMISTQVDPKVLSNVLETLVNKPAIPIWLLIFLGLVSNNKSKENNENKNCCECCNKSNTQNSE